MAELAAMNWVQILGFIADVVTVGAASVTATFAVWKRSKLVAVYRAVAWTYLDQRASRIKETLGRLENLSFDEKGNRLEIRGLFGQLCGQVGSLSREYPEFGEVLGVTTEFVDKPQTITESRKQRLVYQVHGLLEGVRINTSPAVGGNGDG